MLRRLGRRAGSDRAQDRERTAAQRVYLALFVATAGVVVLSALWIVVTGLVARSQLNAVRGEIAALRTAAGRGDTAAVARLTGRIAGQTGSAHQLTSGPAWWVGANIPGLGTPLRTGRIVARQADLVGRQALPGVIGLEQLTRSTRPTSAGVDLAPLQQADGTLQRSQAVIDRAARTVRATDPSWLGLVSGPHRAVVAELTALDSQVSLAHEAVATALPLLGSTRPQRFFLGFMNEAESRGVGGLPGAFAVFTVDRGHVQFTHFGSDDELLGVHADIPVSAEYRSLYGQDNPTTDIRNSDVSPNFPDAARIWAAMWQAHSGQHVDAAIAVDPSAIGFLLAVTGPATLPDGSLVSAANVVSLTQEKQYTLYGSDSIADTQRRKTYLIGIARAVAGKVLADPSLRALAAPARLAIAQRRLVLWSADATQEKSVVALGVGGVLAATPGDAFSGFVTNNAAGGKMDLYLDRSTSYARSSCAAGIATATLVLHNDVPGYALPPYVTTVLGSTPPGTKPGFNRLVLAYYATPGATISRVTLDGAPVTAVQVSEDGLPTVRLLVDLPANSTRTVVVSIREPVTSGPVVVLRQPGVRDIRVSTRAPGCT